MARGRLTKHAIKQVDRLLSNSGIDVDDFLKRWVPHAVGQRPNIVVAMDWTDFDADNQATIMLSLVSSHGRSTPLVWFTVDNRVGEYLFDFWGYAETDKLSLGSGSFVSQSGVTYNHHFVSRRDDFIFWDGDYRLEVFAKVVGNRRAIRLDQFNFEVDGQLSAEMVQIAQLGAFFEWNPDQEKYNARADRRDTP